MVDQILGRHPRERSAREQVELREWVLDVLATGSDLYGVDGSDWYGSPPSLPAGSDLYGVGGSDLYGVGGSDLYGVGGSDLYGRGGSDLYGAGSDLYGAAGSDSSGRPPIIDGPREQQRLLFGQLRGLWLAPHELLQPADAADHRMYIVLRGQLRVFGNDSVGMVDVGGCIGQLAEQEYRHNGTHCAGEDGCMLGVLDYAHSLAAQGRTMPVATQVLQMEPAQRRPQDVRVLFALLEDLPFFQQLSVEAEQLGCCSLLRLQQLKEGTVICEEGTIGEVFCVVLRGSVEVRVAGEGGDPEHLGVGGSFGKLSLLGETDDERRLQSTIVAGPQCVCVALHRDEFLTVRNEVQQQLAAVLAKPFLGRTEADRKLVADVLRRVVTQNTKSEQPSEALKQIAGHATLLSMAAKETVQLPGGSFIYVLEGQVVVDESQALPGFVLGTETGQRCCGVEALYEGTFGRAGGGAGSARECAQLMPIRAKGGGCKLLVVCSTDIHHVRRRTASQPWIDAAWGLCGGGSSDQIRQLEWTDLWSAVLKRLAPVSTFSADTALAWCVSDWDDMLKRTHWGNPQLSCSDDALHHEAFSEALTSQVEEFWGITEPCPTLHAVLLAELLAGITGTNGNPSDIRSQQAVELDAVKCRSNFYMELRNDAHDLMLQTPTVPGQRSALERIEAELSHSSFTLEEAFELEKAAPVYDETEKANEPDVRVGDLLRVSQLASAASAIPSQWSARLDAWGQHKPNAASNEEQAAGAMYQTTGSVEWASQSAENSDDDYEQREPVNPVHPPAAKMKPVAIRGGAPPQNEKDVRMASPPREMPREGPPPPPPGVRLQGSPPAGPARRAPVPPKTPPPVKRRTHKEIAKQLYAERHTGIIERVASEDSFGEEELDRRLPVVSQGLSRNGNTQSWAPKTHKLPQEIHIGNAKGRMRPFQAPPDPKSIDPGTGLPKNRHRTIIQTDSPRNAEKRASARAERQKLRAEKAAASGTVVPGKLAPEPPREVLQPKIIGSARKEADMLTAEPEKIVRVGGVDTDPDRTYAVLPSGVPKEWIALHYKSEKRLKAQKKQAAAQCAAAIARGVKVASARAPIKAVASKQKPFVAALGFAEMQSALQGSADKITASHTITAERWLVREESTFGTGRPPEVVPTATGYGHSGTRKPLERLAPPTPLHPWHPTADVVKTPKAVVAGVDHKWHSNASLAATLVSPRMGSLSARSRVDQGSQAFWFNKSQGAVPEPASCWTVSATDPRTAASLSKGSSQEYSQMWMTTTILDRS